MEFKEVKKKYKRNNKDNCKCGRLKIKSSVRCSFCYLSNIIPWNKGKPQNQWLSQQNINKVRKNLSPHLSNLTHRLKKGHSLRNTGRTHFKKGQTAGQNNSNWKGGVTPLVKKIRNSESMKLWRHAVFERDNYTCKWCGKNNGCGKTIILNAHHIKEFSEILYTNKISTFEEALQCEELWDVSNGITLCKKCHGGTINGRKRLIV